LQSRKGPHDPLVLGSRNKKKLKEMLALLGDLPLELTDLFAVPPTRRKSKRTADTFIGNRDPQSNAAAPALGHG